MPDISLTDFVDFVISSGTPKLTKVLQIKRRGDYQPAHDFWRELREGIVNFHKSHATGKHELDRILATLDDKKTARYADCLSGYKRFLGRKRITWFEPPNGRWTSGGLVIRINPELGLNIEGKRYVVKLYFKKEPLSRRRTDIVRLLLHAALNNVANRPGIHYAILDVPRWKLFDDRPPDQALVPLLNGEASNFITIWNSIQA